MRVIYHPSARVDVFEIVEYYEREAGTELAADFFGELERLIVQIAVRPESFVVFTKHLRRANVRRFPHHVLFETLDDRTVRVLVVKHNRRHPSYGTRRR